MITRNRTLVILSVALVIVTLGFGMVIPIFPFYIEKMGGRGSALGFLVATAAFTELVFGPFWGSYSDRVGRKPVLMVGLTGYALASLLLGLSTELWMLFLSRALSGVLSAATTSTALAYIGDTTSEKDRSGGIGVLGAAAGLGIIVGPGFGGWLGNYSLSLPFFVSAGISLATVLFAYLLLPESLPPEARRSESESSSWGFDAAWRAILSPIGILLLLLFLSSFGLANFEAVFGLYALEKFAYGPGQVGTILMVVGIVSTLGKVFTGTLTARWGDTPIVKVSLLAGAVGFLIMLAADTYVTILLATGFFILSKTFLRPSLLSLISRGSSTGQGTAMGISNSFMNLGRIVGPVWAGVIFDVNHNYPYLSGSLILFLGLLISLAMIRRQGIAEPSTALSTRA